jgi:hypothetical protein
MRRFHRPIRCRHPSVEIERAKIKSSGGGRPLHTSHLCVPSQPGVIQITNRLLPFQSKSLAGLTSCGCRAASRFLVMHVRSWLTRMARRS